MTARKKAAVADTPAAIVQRETARAKREHWELALLQQLRAAHLPEPERQYRFHSLRAYKADFAYVPERLLIEVQGGVWGRRNAQTGAWEAGKHSGHSGGVGMEQDCRRSCDAVAEGWRILPVTPAMVKSGEALRYIEATLHAIWQQRRKAG